MLTQLLIRIPSQKQSYKTHEPISHLPTTVTKYLRQRIYKRKSLVGKDENYTKGHMEPKRGEETEGRAKRNDQG